MRVQLHVMKAFAFKLECSRNRRQALQQAGGQRFSGYVSPELHWHGLSLALDIGQGMKTPAVPLPCCLRKPAHCNSLSLPVFWVAIPSSSWAFLLHQSSISVKVSIVFWLVGLLFWAVVVMGTHLSSVLWATIRFSVLPAAAVPAHCLQFFAWLILHTYTE